MRSTLEWSRVLWEKIRKPCSKITMGYKYPVLKGFLNCSVHNQDHNKHIKEYGLHVLPLIIVRPGVLEAVSPHIGGGGHFWVQLCLHAAGSRWCWQEGAFPGSAIPCWHFGPPRSPGTTVALEREIRWCVSWQQQEAKVAARSTHVSWRLEHLWFMDKKLDVLKFNVIF